MYDGCYNLNALPTPACSYVVKQALEVAEMDVNSRDKDGKTPVMYACEGCATQTLKVSTETLPHFLSPPPVLGAVQLDVLTGAD